jgi:hypothetical protein
MMLLSSPIFDALALRRSRRLRHRGREVGGALPGVALRLPRAIIFHPCGVFSQLAVTDRRSFNLSLAARSEHTHVSPALPFLRVSTVREEGGVRPLKPFSLFLGKFGQF